ncbi:hypothetical protein D3273_03955 [Lichenibacterium minor]|uniref:Uncharacterized protein n=1 Tax=Lichenibacterium minor TaxID=2316528 RepID=A0A4V1RV70_9HYPH|nr:hypothetical protein D3273_03955 [Lichenibacterium minor]
MARHCRSPGCTAEATQYGAYCTSHKSTLRRHGDADQRGITKADLKAPLRAIRGRIERNSGNPVWGQSEGRWREVVGHARAVLARQGAGSAYARQAASETVKLAEAVEAREIMATAFAVYLMADQQPRRFLSDTAFRVQLVRRLRGLTEANAGTWFDHKTGRTKRVYRELPPQAAGVMGEWIAKAFGAVGLFLARMDREQREAAALKADADRVKMAEALEALQ